jgi:hypothetical protein
MLPLELAAMPDNTVSLLRQLKILVVLLLLSNIGLGAFGFFFLRSIDQKYSALIDQSVPTLNALHNLTVNASKAMRSTNPILLTNGKDSAADVANGARAAIEQGAELRDRVLNINWIGAHQELVNLRHNGEKFDQAAADVVALLQANNPGDATKLRESVLRPAFNNYVAATTQAGELLKQDSLTTSNTLSLRTNSLSKVMLGLASWPIMILGTFLAFTALFVLTVLIRVTLFKREHA